MARVIAVAVEGALAEVVADRMWGWGVRGVAESELGDGRVELVTSVGDDDGAIDSALATLDAAWSREVREVDDEVAAVDPAHLAPTWYLPGMASVPASLLDLDARRRPTEVALAGADLVTVVEPGAAFGLGDHPTTRSSMAALAGLLLDGGVVGDPPAHDRVLDVGCGTGALAVLAAQLGATRVRAIDVAPAAVDATRRNAERNGVDGRIEVDATPVGELTGAWPLVVANILAPVLIAMAPDLRRLLAPGGSLVVSGLLAERHDHVLRALEPLAPVGSIVDEGWITIELR